MALTVIGAGAPRTGTFSLKLALQSLLGAPCYHMHDVQLRPDDVPVWRAALAGRPVDWDALFAGYRSACDWPAGLFWLELVEAFPDAVVVLSTRPVADWWASMDATVLEVVRRAPAEPEPWLALTRDLFDMFFFGRTDDGAGDEAAGRAAYETHVAAVRAIVPADRLVIWEATDGWGPLCDALGLPVPDEPFPTTNRREQFRQRNQLA